MGIDMNEKILGVKACRLWDIPGFLTAGWPLSKLVGYAGFANEGELVRALEIYSQKMGIEMPDVSPRTGMRHTCRGWEFTSRPYPMYRPLWGQDRWDCPFLPVRGVQPLGFPNGLTLLPQGGFVVRGGVQPVIEGGEYRTNRILFMASVGSSDGVSLLPETKCSRFLVKSDFGTSISIVAVMKDGDKVVFRKYHGGYQIIEYTADSLSDTGVREVEYSEREYAVKLKLGL